MKRKDTLDPSSEKRGTVGFERIFGGYQVQQSVKKEVHFVLQSPPTPPYISHNPRCYSSEGWALYQQLRGLSLTHQIVISGYHFFTGGQILESGRRYVLGFVLDKGKFHPRLFYYSNSGGNWHATPGVDWDWISKGDFYKDKNVPLNYEKGMLVVPEFAHFLESLPQEVLNPSIKTLGVLPIFGGSCTMIGRDFVQKNVEMDMKGDGITITPFLDDVRSFSEIFGKNMAGYHQSLGNIKQHFRNLMPAYEIASVRRINMSREYHATLATHVDMFCFEGIMNHDIIHIKIGQGFDKPGLFWIEDIYYPHKGASAWATRKHSINAGLFTAKPIEYDTQCPKILENNQRIGRQYIDIRGCIQDNSIIQFFLNLGLLPRVVDTGFQPKNRGFQPKPNKKNI